MRELRRHGVDLLTPLESVSVDELSIANTPDPISKRIIRTNYRELITIYFELADDHSHNPVPFLSSLPPEMFGDAIRAVRIIWGTNNQMRRSSIERSLFDYLQDRIPDEILVGTLKRYVDIGYLTFDKSNPGYTHQPRKQKSMDDIISDAKQTLAEYDTHENAG